MGVAGQGVIFKSVFTSQIEYFKQVFSKGLTGENEVYKAILNIHHSTFSCIKLTDQANFILIFH